jgi:citrate lyase subunit beta/citryl-CoA lyase
MDKIAFPLFLPGLRMDRFDKAASAGADAVILDLEDAVAAAQKDDARAAIVAHLADARPGVPVILRINASDTDWHAADLAACAALSLAGVMLAKAERAEDCIRVGKATGKPVIALIETALGLHNAVAIAGASVRIAFGSIDYAADLGMAHACDSLLAARSALVLAARLGGQAAPWDGVTTDLKDAQVITGDARHALQLGFGGKLLIHPSQIAPARQGFAPAADDIAWARRVVAAAQVDGSAVKLDGAMVDAPVIKRAQAILARARAEDVA